MSPYDAVNAAWPEQIPPITREEARRASTKLFAHFGGRNRPVRKCWIVLSDRPNRTNDLSRGWRRLVHDVSHYVWDDRKSKLFKDHGGLHATLELEMVHYVLEKGWLTGALRIPEKARPDLATRREARLLHARSMLTEWTRTLARAERKVKEWRSIVKRIEKVLAKETTT